MAGRSWPFVRVPRGECLTLARAGMPPLSAAPAYHQQQLEGRLYNETKGLKSKKAVRQPASDHALVGATTEEKRRKNERFERKCSGKGERIYRGKEENEKKYFRSKSPFFLSHDKAVNVDNVDSEPSPSK